MALALAQSGMHEPEAIKLISKLLDYCSLTTEAAQKQLRKHWLNE